MYLYFLPKSRFNIVRSYYLKTQEIYKNTNLYDIFNNKHPCKWWKRECPEEAILVVNYLNCFECHYLHVYYLLWFIHQSSSIWNRNKLYKNKINNWSREFSERRMICLRHIVYTISNSLNEIIKIMQKNYL